MLLGKRLRPALSRNKSSAELPAAVVFDVEAPLLDDDRENAGGENCTPPTRNMLPYGSEWQTGTVSGDAEDEEEEAAAWTASFLRACGLCERRLGPGRDIYMYRGDIAFCSLECRQQRINLDEQKRKCSLVSMKNSSLAKNNNCSSQSDSGGTIPAT